MKFKYYDGDFEDLGLTMSVSDDRFGKVEEIELIPGGSSIPVTNENKILYIVSKANYMPNFRLLDINQAFVRGMRRIISQDYFSYFFPNEIQLLISGGLNVIDTEDLRQNTQIEGWEPNDQPYLDQFWLIISKFSQEEKENLLAFATGANRPPLLGFKYLEPRFCIVKVGTYNTKWYPTSSTCYNQLKLPFFGFTEKGYAMLEETLKEAINSNSGFYNA